MDPGTSNLKKPRPFIWLPSFKRPTEERRLKETPEKERQGVTRRDLLMQTHKEQ